MTVITRRAVSKYWFACVCVCVSGRMCVSAAAATNRVCPVKHAVEIHTLDSQQPWCGPPCNPRLCQGLCCGREGRSVKWQSVGGKTRTKRRRWRRGWSGSKSFNGRIATHGWQKENAARLSGAGLANSCSGGKPLVVRLWGGEHSYLMACSAKFKCHKQRVIKKKRF